MAILEGLSSLVFRNGFDRQKIGTVEFDILDSRDISDNSSLTSNPIEGGGSINDHMIDNPIEISLSGKISEFSIRNSLLSNALTLTNPLTSNSSRLIDAEEELQRLKKEREPLSIVTPYRTYTNMYITSLNIPTGTNTGKAFVFNCVLKQAEIAETQTIAVVNSAIATDNAKEQSNFGKQAVSEATESQTESSIGVFEFIKGVAGFGS